MLTREEFHAKIQQGLRILDGATGSNLRAMGMPNHVCTRFGQNHNTVIIHEASWNFNGFFV